MNQLATYPFAEAIERIGDCNEYWELQILANVIDQDKDCYSPYHRMIIAHALKIMDQVLNG
jgi:hypothetical protein